MNSWRERYDKSIREEAERIERAEAERTESEKFIDGVSLAPDLFLLPVAALVAGIPLLFRYLRRRRVGQR